MDLKPSELTKVCNVLCSLCVLIVKNYLYFDPKSIKAVALTEAPKGRPPFEHAVVFMVCLLQIIVTEGQVGGGNYVEYQNLVEFAEVRL